MIQLFHDASENCSKLVTKTYSTSFAGAIKLLSKDLRTPIFNIYGFVRLADEIVDSFHGFEKEALLEQFKKETKDAIQRGISLNPILHSFQRTINEYDIDQNLIEDFFRSMESDLCKQAYDRKEYLDYIHGSAETVGLMCLKVFCQGNKFLYKKLSAPAIALGAAFQKVNFLRDLQADYQGLARSYFPGCDFNNFTVENKKAIEAEIEEDFKIAYAGIMDLPLKARMGVYVAYKYYMSLFNKIKKMEPARILEQRVRIPNYLKTMIVLSAELKKQLRLI